MFMQCIAAVCGQRRAGDQAGIVGSQDHHAAPDLFRLAPSARNLGHGIASAVRSAIMERAGEFPSMTDVARELGLTRGPYVDDFWTKNFHIRKCLINCAASLPSNTLLQFISR
jgi:hypothetical protein